MKNAKRNQVRDILLAYGFRRQDFDEAFWPDEFIERFLKNPQAGMRMLSRRSGRRNLHEHKWE